MRIDDLVNQQHCILQFAGLMYRQWLDLYLAANIPETELLAALYQRTSTDALPLTLVLLDEQQVVAMGTLKLSEPGTHADLSPWIGGLYVLENYRGAGVGGQLLMALEQRARDLGIAQLYLSADTAVSFYLRHGWQELARVNSYGARDVALMTKVLV